MKAISPALPMTAPSRQSNGVDPSAADEAFSALIAAVIGAPATPSTPSTPSAPPSASSASSRSTTRVDNADDARPAAATPRSTRATHEASDAGTDQTGSGNSSDKAQATDATQRATAEHSDSQQKPGSGPSSLAPKVSSPPSATDQSKVPAGLEKASAALAHALAAASGDAVKSGSVDGRSTGASTDALPVVNPGTALTEGQLPAQLVAAITVAPTPTVAAPLTGMPDAKPGDKPTGKTVTTNEKKPTQNAVLTTPPKPAGSPVVAAPVAVQGGKATQPEAPSDANPSNAAMSPVATTTEHAKSVEPKPTAQDQHPQDATAASHFDMQLSAQAPAPVPTTQLTTVVPVQQPQSAYSSGMVPQQIVQVVAPLRSAKDGDYTLSLQLHPADLGAVTVRVDVQQGVLSVHMSAEHAHGHEALNQSLADLRTQLQTSGVRTGDISVSPKSSVMPQHQEQQQHTGGRHQQEAPTYDDGADRRPGEQRSRQAQQQADDDNLDVRI